MPRAKSKVARPSDNGAIAIKVPLGPEDDGHRFPIHVNIRALDSDVAYTIRRIMRKYDESGATLRNGQRVVTPTTTVRKILEEIHDAAGGIT